MGVNIESQSTSTTPIICSLLQNPWSRQPSLPSVRMVWRGRCILVEGVSLLGYLCAQHWPYGRERDGRIRRDWREIEASQALGNPLNRSRSTACSLGPLRKSFLCCLHRLCTCAVPFRAFSLLLCIVLVSTYRPRGIGGHISPKIGFECGNGGATTVNTPGGGDGY